MRLGRYDWRSYESSIRAMVLAPKDNYALKPLALPCIYISATFLLVGEREMRLWLFLELLETTAKNMYSMMLASSASARRLCELVDLLQLAASQAKRGYAITVPNQHSSRIHD